MADVTKKKSKDLQIVSIDPISLNSYSFSNNTISFFNINKTTQKKEFYLSYIHTKDIISGIVEISRRLDEDEVGDAVELEAYEALGLDSAVEYKIIYLETETTDTKNRAYNVFAFDSELITKTFQNVKSKTKYIDYITAAPFLFESLYNRKIIDGDGIDCFIYFQKNDAFLVIYKNGRYLYSKSLNYSLLQINEKFCEFLGERVDEEEFYVTLAEDGLKTKNASYQQYLMELFGEIFTYINDVMVFFKRSYNIEEINKVYIGSEVGPIYGLVEYSKSYLGIETENLVFNIARNKNENYIDQMHILMLLAGQDYLDSKDDDLNLTIFKRPPAFSKRPSGVLTIASIVALLAISSYPIYEYGHGFLLQLDSSRKLSEYETVHKKANQLRTNIAILERQKKDILTQINRYNQKLQFRKKILNEIHERKVNYPMKGVILDELINLINARNVKITSVKGEDKNVTISLRSNNNKQLTQLLKDIAKTEKYNVDTKEIYAQDNGLLYESNVTTRILK